MRKKGHKKEDQKEKEPYVLQHSQVRAAQFLARNNYKIGTKQKSGVLLAVAAEVGVHHNTITRWLKIEEFRAKIESYTSVLIDAAFEGLERLLRGDALNPPNATAVIFFTKNHFPDRYDDQLRRDLEKFKHQKELLEKENENLKEAIEALPDEFYYEYTKDSAKREA